MWVYALGNEAIAQALMEAGVGVVAGYPGTPSSEIIETLAKMSSDMHIEWSVNEKVALEVAIGASWCGVRATATMKHVGLNACADPFMTLGYTGVRGGLIAVVADDPGCHSSQNEQDTRRYTTFAKVPCLEPSCPQECYELTLEGFDFSEKTELPVVLRTSTRVSHAKQTIIIKNKRKSIKKGKFIKDPKRFVMVPANARKAHQKLEKKYGALMREGTGHSFIEWKDTIGIASSGVARLYTTEACNNLGVSPTILHVRGYPIGEEIIKEFLEECSKVLVVEELEPVVEEMIMQVKAKFGIDTPVYGKLSSNSIPKCGELNANITESVIRHWVREENKNNNESNPPPSTSFSPLSHEESAWKLPKRVPVMCAGCPHRATFYEMKVAFGGDAIFPSDIGCYTLGISMDTVDTTLCMGASITIGSGMYHAGEREVCCTIGDSTFIHTGIPGLINAAYNKANITVVILDNSTTAMTGHQPHPGIGLSARHERTFLLDLTEIAKVCGATYVEVIDPYDVDTSINALKRAREHEGLSVILAKRECIMLRVSKRDKRDYIVEGCKGCKKCLELQCPAIEFHDNKAKINNLCNGCGVCAQICPFEAIREMDKNDS
jgi:indolepyruvate ferredoxin oxidoreductase alpha subunit